MNSCWTELLPSVTTFDKLVAASKNVHYQYVPYQIVGNVSPLLIRADPFLTFLKENFYIKLFQFYKIPPNHYYRFHKDVYERNSAFNMLLYGWDSSSQFLTGKHTSRDLCEIAVLKYAKAKMYLFNTQIAHSVMNFSEDRVILSCSLKHTYEEALERCKDLGLVSS